MLPIGPIGRALRRAVALGVLVAIRSRRALLPAAGLLVLGYAALSLTGRPAAAPSAAPRADRPAAAGAPAPATRLTTTRAAAVPSVDSYIRGLTQFDARLMW